MTKQKNNDQPEDKEPAEPGRRDFLKGSGIVRAGWRRPPWVAHQRPRRPRRRPKTLTETARVAASACRTNTSPGLP